MNTPTLNDIAIHLVETTASAGAKYRPTPWAATVAFVVANRQLRREMHLHILALRNFSRKMRR